MTSDGVHEVVVPDGADLLVVGAGSAGAVVAGRLSGRADRSVVVLEAGPDPLLLGDEVTGVLGDASSLAAAYDPRCSDGLVVDLGGSRTAELRRGRVVGGSSAVNGAYFVRGRPEDFRRWVARGNDVWSDEAVAAGFERLEHDCDLGDRPGHGDRGPVPVRRDLALSGVTEGFFGACERAGHTELTDLNGPDGAAPADGFGVVPRNVRDVVGPDGGMRRGTRVSIAAAYLDPHRDRPNLVVAGGCPVMRVLVDGGRVSGVELEIGRDDDSGTRVVAAGEVVLSAGSVGSTQLLLRSGIGPADELRALGIPVVLDAPGVGTATFDHPCVDLMYRPVEGAFDPAAGSFMQGVLHLADGVEIMATRLPYGLVTSRDPDDQLLSLRVTLMRPRSRGRLRLGPDGTTPILQHASLAEETDRALVRGGVRAACGLATDPAFAVLVGTWLGPDPDVLVSDDRLDRWILDHLGTAFHLSGTAPMGPASVPAAVVDPCLRVHGIDGLRIVDASVMPEPLSRGPAASVVMIGELAATLIDRSTLG